MPDAPKTPTGIDQPKVQKNTKFSKKRGTEYNAAPKRQDIDRTTPADSFIRTPLVSLRVVTPILSLNGIFSGGQRLGTLLSGITFWSAVNSLLTRNQIQAEVKSPVTTHFTNPKQGKMSSVYRGPLIASRDMSHIC